MTDNNNQDSSASKNHFGNWGIYAAAAGATLAMSTNAEAVIIYTSVGQSVSIPTTPGTSHDTALRTFPISIQGHHGTESLYLRRFSAVASGASRGVANIFGPLPLATAGGLTSSGGHAAKNFLLGAVIGGSQNFSGHGGTFLEKHTSEGAIKGFFGGVQTGFVGFSDFGHYGWAEIMISDAGSPGYPNQLKVIAYAYNSVAESPITAGQGIPGTPTPEPTTAALGLLAAGAAGIALWRRRRKEVDAA